MSRTRDEILEEKRRLRWEYGKLSDAVAALLFQYDPVGINFEVNPDEYETETRTILPRLRDCQSVDDVRRVIYEEFVRWFAGSAGSEEHYAQVANEVWRLWLEFGSERRLPT
jgi:hypothetical protein